MKEQLKARFFGMHIGAQVFMEKHKELDVVFRGVSEPVGVNGFNLHCTRGGRHAFIAPIDQCKLILRQLPSITDGEAIECAVHAVNGIFTGNPFVKRIDAAVEIIFDEGSVYIWHGGTVGVYGHRGQALVGTIASYDYLRSRNFCLPFMGLDPVAEEWAILETKNLGQQ